MLAGQGTSFSEKQGSGQEYKGECKTQDTN
jgi:hypothetical protein